MSRSTRSTAAEASQVRDAQIVADIRRITWLGMEDNGITVIGKYLTTRALDELGIGGSIRAESAGLAKSGGKPANSLVRKALGKLDIDCEHHISRSIHDSNSLSLCDLVFCTDQAAFTHAKTTLDASVQVIRIEGLGPELGNLTGKPQYDHDEAAKIVNAYVRKFFRAYADALAEQ